MGTATVKMGLGLAFRCFMGGAILLVVGCGSSGSSPNGGGAFTTSVSGSKPLGALTTAEKTQLCKDASAFLQSSNVVLAECKLAGVFEAEFSAAFDSTLTDTELRAACTDGVNQCVASEKDGGTSTTMTTCNTDQAVPASCTATVADYTACISTLPQSLGAAAPECNTITRASLGPDAGIGDSTGGSLNSPACVTLSTKCPGIFDTSTPDGGAP